MNTNLDFIPYVNQFVEASFNFDSAPEEKTLKWTVSYQIFRNIKAIFVTPYSLSDIQLLPLEQQKSIRKHRLFLEDLSKLPEELKTLVTQHAETFSDWLKFKGHKNEVVCKQLLAKSKFARRVYEDGRLETGSNSEILLRHLFEDIHFRASSGITRKIIEKKRSFSKTDIKTKAIIIIKKVLNVLGKMLTPRDNGIFSFTLFSLSIICLTHWILSQIEMKIQFAALKFGFGLINTPILGTVRYLCQIGLYIGTAMAVTSIASSVFKTSSKKLNTWLRRKELYETRDLWVASIMKV